MDWDDLFPWFALAAFGVFGLSLKSFFEARSLRPEFTTLAARVQTLDAQLERPQTAPPIVEPAPPPAPAAGPLPEPADAAAEATTEALELPVAPQPVAAGSGNRWEQVLAENWLVWLGGGALALGGGFFVKLSLVHWLLNPAASGGVRVRLRGGLFLRAGLRARARTA